MAAKKITKNSKSLKQKFDEAYVEMRGKSAKDRESRSACKDCGCSGGKCKCGK
jgi:hypothetical protein